MIKTVINSKGKKLMKLLLVCTFVLAIMLPTVAMAAIEPQSTTPYSYGYSIAQGSGTRTWNGKSNGAFWECTAGQKTWYASITSTASRTISASLYKQITLWPDEAVYTGVSLTGYNGTYFSRIFQPNTSASYYATISSSDALGVQGKTTIS